MADQWCPAWGPGSPVCPRSICDCWIDQFPDDMEQAGALHPEFFTVVAPAPCFHPHSVLDACPWCGFDPLATKGDPF